MASTLRTQPKNSKDTLTIESDGISLFYILPKIHKENIPGRPRVSAVKSLTENISLSF